MKVEYLNFIMPSRANPLIRDNAQKFLKTARFLRILSFLVEVDVLDDFERALNGKNKMATNCQIEAFLTGLL